MTSHEKLLAVMASAYRDRAGGHAAALAEFFHHANADRDFLAHAKAEHDRLSSVEGSLGCPLSQRCYASSEQLKFLRVALTKGTP